MKGKRQEAFRSREVEETEVELFLSAWAMEDGDWK